MKFIRCVLLLFILASTLAFAQITQFQHVIIVIQENRTPDNLFHEDSTLRSNGAEIADLAPATTAPIARLPACRLR
jgi:phospholipase C